MDVLKLVPILAEEGDAHQSKYYPTKPYYNQIKTVFEQWQSLNSCSELFTLLFHLDLEQNRQITKFFQDTTPEATKELFEKYDPYVREGNWTCIADNLQAGEIKLLLGIRKTVGSIDTMFPPSLNQLLDAFEQPHSPADTLTVGSRALSKHVHRSSSGWYGVTRYSGTRDEKNQAAVQLIRRMIDNAVWLNIHSLPHEVYVLEIRVTEGYGARWTCVPEIRFRGFLEPMMEGGHEQRWRHD
ncbi:hypothetical protein HDV01_005807 [Terramyces sp. JEL0728]|nr:hypothetical protein HDV01_005807 [Terramyces sp. JEL0728]